LRNERTLLQKDIKKYTANNQKRQKKEKQTAEKKAKYRMHKVLHHKHPFFFDWPCGRTRNMCICKCTRRSFCLNAKQMYFYYAQQSIAMTASETWPHWKLNNKERL